MYRDTTAAPAATPTTDRPSSKGPMSGNPISDREVVTPAALAFVARLDHEFAAARRELLDVRRARRARLNSGEESLDFRAETAAVRGDPSWRVAGAPAEDCAAGPGEPGASDPDSAPLVDVSETSAPSWPNVLAAQRTIAATLGGAPIGGPGSEGPGSGEPGSSEPASSEPASREPASVTLRPRGWHLVEKHLSLDGRPVSATLVDVGLALFHGASVLARRPGALYIELPRVDSHLEARMWHEVLTRAQELVGLQPGTVGVRVPIETITAAFELDEILGELRDYVVCLAASPYAYAASVIKNFGEHGADYVLPEPAGITGASPFVRAYLDLLTDTARRRGARAHLGTEWHGSPDASSTARPAGATGGGVRAALLDVASAGGEITEDGLRANVSVALRYTEAWLRGAAGVVATTGEAAAAELARCLLWQWVHDGAKLTDGTVIDGELVTGLADAAMATAGGDKAAGDTTAGGQWRAARDALLEDALAPALPSSPAPLLYGRHLVAAGRPVELTARD